MYKDNFGVDFTPTKDFTSYQKSETTQTMFETIQLWEYYALLTREARNNWKYLLTFVTETLQTSRIMEVAINKEIYQRAQTYARQHGLSLNAVI